MCVARDSETLTLNQTKFNCILNPYTRLMTKNPHPIPDSLFSVKSVTMAVKALEPWMTVHLVLIWNKNIWNTVGSRVHLGPILFLE